MQDQLSEVGDNCISRFIQVLAVYMKGENVIILDFLKKSVQFCCGISELCCAPGEIPHGWGSCQNHLPRGWEGHGYRTCKESVTASEQGEWLLTFQLCWILRLLTGTKFWAQGAKTTFMQQFRSTGGIAEKLVWQINIVLNISSCSLQMLLLWDFNFIKKTPSFKAGSLFSNKYSEVNIFLMIEWPTCWSFLPGII